MAPAVTPPDRIGVRELRANLAEYLSRTRDGATFLVVSRGDVLAQIGPPPVSERARRRPGALRGRISLSADFDATPGDLIDITQNEPV